MIKSPIGDIEIYIRNFESLKTIFSIFCRKDYYVENKKFHYIDLGANCGYAALFFLSRNHTNTVSCYEPDPYNIEFLKKRTEKLTEDVEKLIRNGSGKHQ